MRHPKTGWVVVGPKPRSSVWLHTLAPLRRQALDAFVGDSGNWAHFSAKGFRVEKVKIDLQPA